MEKQLIRFDWAIKNILRDKENYGILEGFLSELLKEDIIIIDILESESNQSSGINKYNRVDILAKDKNESYIIFEVQVVKELDYLSRILFGVSKVIAERLEKSSQYKNVKKVYSVSIVFFDLGHGEDYVYKGTTNFYGIHKSDKLELNEQQKAIYEFEKVEEIFPEYYILKVEQFDNNTRDSLDEWIYFLKNEKIKENSMAKGLKEAEEKLNILKMNEEDRRKYDGYVEELRLELSIVESSYGIGKMEGREEGIQEGIKKGIHLVAENMLKTGVEEEIIIKATGLTLEQLKSIKNGSDK